MRRVAVAVSFAFALALVADPASAQTTGGGGEPTAGSAAESTEAASNWGWGIEIRQAGLGPCRDATPAPCYGFVYNVVCPLSAPGQLRLSRVRTYFGAVGTNFNGFRLRAKLIERGQPARSVPWSTPDVEQFPARRGLTEKLMDTKNISGLVPADALYDIQVEYRFFRTGALADIVRVRRSAEDVSC